MEPKEERHKPGGEGGAGGTESAPAPHGAAMPIDRNTLALLFSPNQGDRDNALAALGDRKQAFKNLCSDFSLQRTSAIVDSPAFDGGTTAFEVQPERAIVPSIAELSISLDRKGPQDHQDVSVSLSCLFVNEATPSEVEAVANALEAFNPVTVLELPIEVTISFTAARGDVVPQLEGILERLHKPCGVHRNMSLDAACDALLGLPELNQRAVEIFRETVRNAADGLLNSALQGRLPDEATIDSTLRKLARAQGIITAFDLQKAPLLEDVVARSADATGVYFDAVSKCRGSLGAFEATEQLSSLMHEFVAKEDLPGLCGVTALVMLGRRDAILEADDDITAADGLAELFGPSDLSPLLSAKAIDASDELLSTCLEKLPLLAKNGDDVELVERLVHVIMSENAEFDKYIEQAEAADAREKEARPESSVRHVPPQWALNSFLLDQAVHYLEKEPAVQEVLSEVVSILQDNGERLRAQLVRLSVVNPSLQAAVLGIIDEKGVFSSAVTLADEIHAMVKGALPVEVTRSMYSIVNYLADQCAIQNEVVGYKLGEGICKDRSEA